uniref:Chaperone TorD involved in molybdoenzyme TorA maturation n=1 Tax=Candidatus Kentrum sp. DK TaxID=2126562 RepID=A0A450S485_9GAMM|nr:MAG: chaperone TorD involved in molybdoenzyme TorA maturation [Candidatus Kentron sp. DK]VFJ46749.1 MAG: chaperone TorD involved in molybdoenzyme TorA maturation [Candidatus Kentron sp. DK]
MQNQINPEFLRLLAGLLAAPEDDSLSVLSELAEAHAWLREPATELAERGLPHWQAEHTSLFVSHYPKTICPPFESAYRGGTMGGSVVEELSLLYAESGLKAEENMPPDYLGTILECAAWLLEEKSAEDPLYRALWEKHVADWVPRFADDMMNREEGLLLYRRLGERMKSIIEARD